jgi:molybdenum cofactor synthesis domain-containing protein
MIRVAVLTISDSCVAGTRTDLSGPAVAERAAALGWQVVHRGVLPDEAARISEELARLADSGAVDVTLTSGGTGVAARDVTPEATRAVIEREIPGLGELMRSEGMKFTRRAALSRAVAGSRGRCLIVNLPGSPKGARESLDAVADLIGHIVDLLQGRTGHDGEPAAGGG